MAREWATSFTPSDRAALGGQTLPLYRKVLRMPAAERDAVRARLTPALVPVLERSTTPTDRWLLTAHRDLQMAKYHSPE